MPTRTRLAVALGASAVAAVPASVAASMYVVRPGDTLIDIAVRHGTTTTAIADANRIADAESLRVGQLLTIPDPNAGLPAYARGGADTETYAVRGGEGIFEVARRFGVDPTALARTNGVNVNAALRDGVPLDVPGRLARVSALLTQAASEVGLESRLVLAVAWVESAWRQEMVSPTGAVGLMQLEPSTGDWVSRQLAGRRLDIWTAPGNARAGSLLLHHLISRQNGDVDAALAAYYQGEASVASRGQFDDTRRYLRSVNLLTSES